MDNFATLLMRLLLANNNFKNVRHGKGHVVNLPPTPALQPPGPLLRDNQFPGLPPLEVVGICLQEVSTFSSLFLCKRYHVVHAVLHLALYHLMS